MMNSRHFALLALLTAANIIFAIFVFSRAEPKTEQLDKDIAIVQAEMKATDDEMSHYNGGLILAELQIKKQILANTVAMLQQKRSALARFINMDYRVDGKAYDSAKPELVDSIEKDLAASQGRIAAADAKAQQYNGGLIQTMALMQAATEGMTQAALEQRLMAAKYGLPSFLPAEGGTAEKPNPGATVPDKDAL